MAWCQECDTQYITLWHQNFFPMFFYFLGQNKHFWKNFWNFFSESVICNLSHSWHCANFAILHSQFLKSVIIYSIKVTHFDVNMEFLPWPNPAVAGWLLFLSLGGDLSRTTKPGKKEHILCDYFSFFNSLSLISTSITFIIVSCQL